MDRVVEQYVAIQITDENKVLANSIELKLLKPIPTSSPTPTVDTQCSIYRVRENLRNINTRAYTPEMISIGPFHHGADSLAAMEDTKLRYAHALLSRTRTSKLEECIARIKTVEDEARKCYSEPIPLTSNEFVEMMVIDGLFMIELFTKSVGIIEIELDDPVFGFHGGHSSLIHDLVLLENQLPMVVLNCLFDVLALKEESDDMSIAILSLKFLDYLMPKDDIWTSISSHEEKHLLDLLSKTFHDLPPQDRHMGIYGWKFIPSVTELKRAGVKFERRSRENFLNIIEQ